MDAEVSRAPRVLVDNARKKAVSYELQYGEESSPKELVNELATVMQEYTQSGGVRPFGVSLLVGGWDRENGPILYQVDPSGARFTWKATALGKNYVNSRTFLEKRYSEDLELDDAIHTALLTLKEGFDEEMTERNIQVAIINKDGYQFLSQQTIKDHISALFMLVEKIGVSNQMGATRNFD
uniref:Proteasome subunit alpha type 2 n=1 Tax=Romanomermis culicivorax TaxID=13658 RepID=A0A915I0W9_ROMCU